MAKINRNDPCPCGSGKKFKKCCGVHEHTRKQRKFSAFKGAENLFKACPVTPSTAMARHVFKILTSPMGTPASAVKSLGAPSAKVPEAVPAPQVSNEEEIERPRTYESLEELIGVEGSPKAEPRTE